MVDVRRARERILYEDYLKMLGNGASVSQQLLFPERLVLSGDEYALLEENAVEFASLGFDIDFAGEGTIEVKGTPADMPADAVDQMVYDLLQAFSTPGVACGSAPREDRRRHGARRGERHSPQYVARRSRRTARPARCHGQFQFLALGQSHNSRNNPRRYPYQTGIIRWKNVLL